MQSQTVSPGDGQILAFERRISELEDEVQRKNQELDHFRIRDDKAIKKIKQLLAKLQQRDRMVEHLQASLDVAKARVESLESAARRPEKKTTHKGLTSQDLAANERAEIVAQLDCHLTTMRGNLAKGEQEIQELHVRRRNEVRAEALDMIDGQIKEKSLFTSGLHAKIRNLEEQVAPQRAMLDNYTRRRAGSHSSSAEQAAPHESPVASRPDSLEDWLAADRVEESTSEAIPQARARPLELNADGSPRFAWSLIVDPKGENGDDGGGSAALVNAARNWAQTLEQLSLEMNGLGDCGCCEVSTVVSKGILPGLRSLELGWNELSLACVPSLERLLRAEPRQLRRLGLGGNHFGPEGASALALAALDNPFKALELDLSMNHATSHPLAVLADWAERCHAELDVAVCINLEWNSIDDAEVVERLAEKLGQIATPDALSTRPPVVRLANNEFAGLSTQDLFEKSRGMVVC